MPASYALVDRLQAARQRRWGVVLWRTHVLRADGQVTLCGQRIGEHDTRHWTRWSTTWTHDQLVRLQTRWPMCRRCLALVAATERAADPLEIDDGPG